MQTQIKSPSQRNLTELLNSDQNNANFKYINVLAKDKKRFPIFKRLLGFFRFLFSAPGIKTIWTSIWHLASFTFLLSIYLVNSQIVRRIANIKFLKFGFTKKILDMWSLLYVKITSNLDKKSNSISRLYLIELSIRNMQSKRVRSLVTIGGMSIGIGTIVFLVSIGYGLEHLVVSRVARLDEMRQTEISMQSGSKIRINDKTIASFKDIPQVDSSMPLIAVVGRINYKNSISDVAVYGVTAQYLQQSAIKPIQGKIFDSNELVTTVSESKPEVAGVSTEAKTGKAGQKIQDLEFNIQQSEWIRVREGPDTKSRVLGYTRRAEGKAFGEEYWGTTYISDDDAGISGFDENGKPLGRWIKSKVYLWKDQDCEQSNNDCENGQYLILRGDDGLQIQKLGYFAEININKTVTLQPEPKVLGESTPSATAASDSAAIDWVEIASEAGIIKPPETKKVALGESAEKQAVVNRSLLRILGINEADSIGQKFSVSFVVVGDLLDSDEYKVESIPTEYEIIGVIPDEKSPVFYVPFVDLRSIGITNYSQIKVVVKNSNDLVKVRKQIEAMGYSTKSVVDTVSQINSLFNTVKIVLAILGMVALAVAALGMFNTLTVSLMERTREVGLMKAMGMKSAEIKELFLTESMIMGFMGGISGITVGFITGKMVGAVLSAFAVFKGIGIIDVSYIPISFILIITSLSLLVGVFTGFYPARRATKISALNALRYE